MSDSMIAPGGLRRLMKGIFKQVTTGLTPPSGSNSLYFKTDGLLYQKNSSGVETLAGGGVNITSATDPLTNAATSTAIVNAYSGTLITTTTTGNSQTLQSPTTAALNRTFTVINNDTSTNLIPVVANSVTYNIAVGYAQTFIWDGTKWLPTSIGITSLPVPVSQGGTGAVTCAGWDMSVPPAIGATTPANGFFADLRGARKVTTHGASEAVTAATMYGDAHRITGAYTLTLPTAVIGMNATFMATTAAVFSLDPNASEVMYLNGTALTGGYKITSDGSLRAKIYIECTETGVWGTIQIQNIFTDGGA